LRQIHVIFPCGPARFCRRAAFVSWQSGRSILGPDCPYFRAIMNSFELIVLCLIPLVIWRVYARARRLVGRQRSLLRRHYGGIIVYSILLGLLGLHSLAHPESLAALAGGALAGISLALFGLHLTRFESTPGGYYYTPNAHIGIFLSLAFVCRLAYRLVQVYTQGQAIAKGGVADFARSPLTLVVIGALAGYFVVYAIGVLLWRYKVKLPPSGVPNGQANPD
jgi:hypothetical protein